MKIAGIVLFLVGCYTTLAAICPTDWQRYGESCYLLITQPMSWADANDACVKSNAALAVPNSKIEQTFIGSMFLEFFIKREPTRYLWIGCYFSQEVGEWQHCPLRNVSNTFEKWNEGNPESDEPATDCVAMNLKHNGQWADKPCRQNHPTVCELRLDITPQSFCLQTGPDGRIKSHCLVGHVINELPAIGAVLCGKACRSEPSCRSFNLLMKQGQGKMVCQLNNATRHEALNSAMVEKNNCYCFDL